MGRCASLWAVKHPLRRSRGRTCKIRSNVQDVAEAFSLGTEEQRF